MATYRRITIDEARSLMDAETKPVVIDVRDPASYQKGHIDGALRVDLTNLDTLLKETPKTKPVLIYCYHGNSSQAYAKAFGAADFADVFSMDGGYEEWRKAEMRQNAAPIEEAPTVEGLSDALEAFLKEHGYPKGGVNAVTPTDRMTPLMRACHLNAKAIVTELLQAGARVDASNNDQNQALWLACVGDDPDIVDMIIAAGADLNHANVNGSTALIYAASAGKAKALARLLAAGADLDYQVDGFSAIDMASTLECLNMMREAKRRAKAAKAGS
ncbi:rhodanese-like domain-containing protein [Beijerinckia indica]|uniref:Rhodanese domain protein n=1 Tax=Beijerinckia indica subsp. indica (strain ATCC 9039 / DSM 1715 / NCIMB 8712) TaxID=395963 RepID=B2IES8_BEII9|nr:rhodanese-like domain-containing protein [Beijerinckia indica]ACB94122.1 Rhodanese domain protein [Beijerinckia indica subsp. indica ATCC 9039]